MIQKTNKIDTDKEYISYEKVVDVFKAGRILFNNGKMYESYEKWEIIWKYGDLSLRKDIKGYLQLSGGLWNKIIGNTSSVNYLLKKASENIKKGTLFIEDLNKSKIIDFINFELNHSNDNSQINNFII
ncbi:MAG: DUF309 domain-containing protein [Candidatus Marinimicrobia bacterium]|nr:DUF309 domain-containing protein [Candidatus Neomarinimicrobiota bacterium]